MTFRDELAQFIEQSDAGNEPGPGQLGAAIGRYLSDRGMADEALENAVEDFVYDANLGVGYLHPKRLTGAALADALIKQFDLEKEITR